MATVELKAVGKSYGGVRAVSAVDLQVADGELVVLVGPSGCGKSTLLKMIAGLEDITSGTLSIGGVVANEQSPQERNVAMVFQDYALYPHLTVRGNLEFPLRMRRMAAAERRQRVEETARLLGIEELLERLPRAISGGQRQRVAMGRALVRNPSVFLLDEPLSNLDAKLRTQVRGEIHELQRRTRTTMIYVTHDQGEAMTLGDRVVVLRDGAVQQIGTPRELYGQPANVFVAGFIGTPPMNLLPADLSEQDGQLVVRVGGQVFCRRPWDNVVDRAQPLVGGRVTVGFRPEAVLVVEPSAPEAIEVRIAATEFLGHETLVRYELPGGDGAEPLSFFGRSEGAARLDEGRGVFVRAAADATHLFAPSGVALAGRGGDSVADSF